MTDIERLSKDFVKAAERTNTLYALSDQYLYLVDLLEDPDADPALIEQELDRVGGQIAHKAEAIAGLIAWYEGLAGLRKAEAQRMAQSVSSFEKQAERLRSYVLKHMQATGMTRIDTARFSLTLRQNPPRVEILEPMLVPREFQREKIVIDVDKRKILEHVKATGEVVEGTEIVRGTRLEIR